MRPKLAVTAPFREGLRCRSTLEFDGGSPSQGEASPSVLRLCGRGGCGQWRCRRSMVPAYSHGWRREAARVLDRCTYAVRYSTQIGSQRCANRLSLTCAPLLCWIVRWIVYSRLLCRYTQGAHLVADNHKPSGGGCTAPMCVAQYGRGMHPSQLC